MKVVLEGFPVRALFVGLMHGMAGSAALNRLADCDKCVRQLTVTRW